MATKDEKYESPSHALLQAIRVRVPPEIGRAYAAACALAGTTKQAPIAEFCKQYAIDHGVKIPRTAKPRRRSSDTPKGP